MIGLSDADQILFGCSRARVLFPPDGEHGVQP